MPQSGIARQARAGRAAAPRTRAGCDSVSQRGADKGDLHSSPMTAPRPSSLDTGHRNLWRVVALRWSALAALAVLLAVSHWQFALALPWSALAVVVAVAAAINVATQLRLRHRHAVSEIEVAAQLLVDVAVLATTLGLTGGWANPFVSLFLLPVIIAATLLATRFAWVVTATAFAGYSLLGFVARPLPHLHGEVGDFDLHVLGMWVAFALCAGAVASVVTRMARSLRARDRALADARERALRDAQVLALATLAAGAAHELGTPLATMAVVAGELARAPLEADLREDVAALRAQIAECRRIVDEMAASAGAPRAEAAAPQPVDDYLERAIRRWRALRPAVDVTTHWIGDQPAPRIVPDRTLDQTLVSLLNNAADANPDGIEMHGSWRAGALELEIRDRGTGVAADVLDVAGRARISTKSDGLGMGLLLARAAIERFGGHVELANRTDTRGATTRIVLPLARPDAAR
jgi:two-component system sensor histidine kinase RegB